MAVEQDVYPIVSKIEFFRDFSREEVERLLNVGSWVKAPAGTTMITEGDDDLYLYVLVSGVVDVVKNGKALARLAPGDSFGEISALARTPRTAHVIARSEVYCVRFEPQLFDRLPTELQLKMVKRLLFSLARRLTAMNRRFSVS